MCDLDVEIRKLSPKVVFELSQILEMRSGWKDLMGIVTNENGSLKYTVEHMRLIEDASEKQKRTCAEIFLEEWGTSGKKLPRLSDLLNFLKDIQLYRAADYISVELLKQDAPERPDSVSDTQLPPVVMLSPTAPSLSRLNSSTENIVQLENTVKLTTNLNKVVCPESLKHYTYKELIIGTKGFSSELELGRGGFGSVYKCNLQQMAESVAVKRIGLDGAIIQGIEEKQEVIEEKQFLTEVKTLCNLSHPNLLPIIGFSCDGPHRCIIYPFMVNGSLQDRIERKNDSKILEWNQRLDIAVGTAKGLHFLHTKPLVHRDVKSANILLDGNFVPKVGDFGLARQGSFESKSIALTTTIVGTNAYMAPEAFRGDVSVKMDVFSFGVVLLELITGLPPFDEERKGRDLLSHVDEFDEIEAIIDSAPETCNKPLALALYDIAQKCLLPEKKLRPVMAKILELLESITI